VGDWRPWGGLEAMGGTGRPLGWPWWEGLGGPGRHWKASGRPLGGTGSDWPPEVFLKMDLQPIKPHLPAAARVFKPARRKAFSAPCGGAQGPGRRAHRADPFRPRPSFLMQGRALFPSRRFQGSWRPGALPGCPRQAPQGLHGAWPCAAGGLRMRFVIWHGRHDGPGAGR
jgi:hypothetical protein